MRLLGSGNKRRPAFLVCTKSDGLGAGTSIHISGLRPARVRWAPGASRRGRSYRTAFLSISTKPNSANARIEVMAIPGTKRWQQHFRHEADGALAEAREHPVQLLVK